MRYWFFSAPKKRLSRSLLIKASAFFVLFALAGLLVYSVGTRMQPAFARQIQSGELVRLHIVANSDDDRDQEIKLHVRDRVLEYLSPMLLEASSMDEAQNIVLDNLAKLQAVAKAAAAEMGFFGEVQAGYGVYPFPDRTYAGYFVPAGDYEALRIVLGAGQGHNWWCVMYPPLCFVGEECVGLQEVHFESAILKWVKGLHKNKEEPVE